MDANTKDVLFLAVPAVSAVVMAYFAHKQNQQNAKIDKATEKIEVVEKHTNSMKDALVLATATASHAQGREEERAIQQVAASQIAKGVAQQKAEQEPRS